MNIFDGLTFWLSDLHVKYWNMTTEVESFDSSHKILSYSKISTSVFNGHILHTYKQQIIFHSNLSNYIRYFFVKMKKQFFLDHILDQSFNWKICQLIFSIFPLTLFANT